MNLAKRHTWFRGTAILACATLALAVVPAFAQDYDEDNYYQAPPPSFAPAQLDDLVGRIALYPDPLLAQVLAAATFPQDIPDAAGWANQYSYLRGDDLARAMEDAQLPWDPSVQALLPFPSVLNMMAQDMNWTNELGEAVLAQRPDVMDAVQRMRREADAYGYLRTNPQIRVVDDGGWIEVLPVDAGYIYVPVYDPYIVYAPPRPGFWVGGAIHFGPAFTIGFSFGNWGWGGGFDWRAHNVVVNHVVWGRTWTNQRTYVHNYGNWDGGRWPRTVNRNVTINRNVTVNRNVDVNRQTTVNRDFNRDGNRDNNRGGNQNVNRFAPNIPAPAPAPPSAARSTDNRMRPFAPAPVAREQRPEPQRFTAPAPQQREQRAEPQRVPAPAMRPAPAPAHNERPAAPAAHAAPSTHEGGHPSGRGERR